MKKILIIYPHFPPSNLAGVHRPRLFAQHLRTFGWEPVVLTVDEKYYEEDPDWNLVKLLPKDLRIVKVNAFGITRPRMIGDIGLRAFFQLYRKAKSMIRKEHFDFVYISIPSFYTALLGRWLNSSTGIHYGIDYIDPWVHEFPGSDKIFSRHWFSLKLSKILEPIAIKRASIITGVAEGYYEAVFERNPELKHKIHTAAMPYGGEIEDHSIIGSLGLTPYLFSKENGKIKLMYAGAMLPKAYKPLEAIFKSIKNNPELFSNVEFYFIGTGKRTNDPNSYNIKPLADKYGLYGSVIFEHPSRVPYLDVLLHLSVADGIFILGSTEPHYTPSKTYQGVLSEKFILAVLHNRSTAVQVLRSSNAGIVLGFDGEKELDHIEREFADVFKSWLDKQKVFSPSNVKRDVFEQYSAKSVTKKLVDLLNQVIP